MLKEVNKNLTTCLYGSLVTQLCKVKKIKLINLCQTDYFEIAGWYSRPGHVGKSCTYS